MAAGVFAVQAAPVTPTPEPIKPSFTDGRINAYDPGAPVAVFETRKTVPIVNDNGEPTTADVVNGVQLLFWDGATAKEVMHVSADTINSVVNRFMGNKSTTTTANTTSNSTTTTSASASATPGSSSSVTANSPATNNANTTATSTKLTTVNNGNSVLISKVNGYSLYFSKDGYLWITTPANFEGKVYTFSWQKNF
jgi:hypothetical protein